MSQRQETRKAGKGEETVTRVSIEGQGRFGVKGYSQKEPFRLASVDILADSETPNAAELKTLRESVQKAVMELLQQAMANGGNGQQNPLGNLVGADQQIKWPASA